MPHMFCSGIEHHVGLRVVGARRPVLAAAARPGRSSFVSPMPVNVASGLTVTSPVAPSMLLDHVLHRPSGRAHRNSPVCAVERVDDAGLAGDAGDHLAPLARLDLRGLIHAHFLRVGRDRGLHQQPLEGMVEVPVIDDVLVVPDDLAGVGVERERRVVVQVLLVVAARMNFGAGIVTDVPTKIEVQSPGRSSAPSRCPTCQRSPSARRPTSRRPARPGSGIVRVRHSSLPVLASCAVMMQASLPASGWHWRPVMTLPLAMIGPALARRALLRRRSPPSPRPACRCGRPRRTSGCRRWRR